MAVMMFFQGLMGSILISIANTIFDNSLLSEIRSRAPGATAEAVLAAGATAFRKVVSPEQLPNVLEAYATSFDRVFYLAIGLTATTFVVSCGLGWRDVKKIKKQATEGILLKRRAGKRRHDCLKHEILVECTSLIITSWLPGRFSQQVQASSIGCCQKVVSTSHRSPTR